ncbi:hypothetical protein OK016_13945 [Vibrio chagasii]|nr:hypothetical protein [Vibrio chagasii]
MSGSLLSGDRTSTSKESRSVWAEFLQGSAVFPQGPFMLASVPKAPVFLLFGLRGRFTSKPGHFNVYFVTLATESSYPENTLTILKQVVQQYADRLQHYTLKAPLPVLTFLIFWTLSNQHHDEKESK